MTLYAYICNKIGCLLTEAVDGAVEVVESCDGSENNMETSAVRVVVPIIRSDHDHLRAPIMSLTDAENLSLTDFGAPGLTYRREALLDNRGQFRVLDDNLVFSFDLWPEDLDDCAPCAWKGVVLSRRNLVTCTDCLFYKSVPTLPYPGPVPDTRSDSRSDSHHLVRAHEWTTGDPECVPGEQLRLIWNFLMGGTLRAETVSSLRFVTPAVDGGRVVNISGAMTLDRKITVALFGLGELVLTPTDFADYQVGSWVYLLRDTAAAHETTRESDFTISDTDLEVFEGDPADAFRPAPLLFNDGENPGLVDDHNWQARPYSLTTGFRDGFELSWHTAAIVAVNAAQNSVDVTCPDLAPGVLSSVPVYYHCPHAGDVSDGHLAFGVGDAVIVVSEGEDRFVVGFADRMLRLCGTIMVFRLWDPDLDDTRYLVYRHHAAGGQIYNIVDAAGATIAQPFFLSQVGATLNELMTINGLARLSEEPGQNLTQFVIDTQSTSGGDASYNLGAPGEPSGSPPECKMRGDAPYSSWSMTQSILAYRFYLTDFFETFEIATSETRADADGTIAWRDACVNELCTECYRLPGHVTCEEFSATADDQILDAGKYLWGKYQYAELWHGWETDYIGCFYDAIDCDDEKDYYTRAVVHYLNEDTETVAAAEKSGLDGHLLMPARNFWHAAKYYDEGARAVVGEGVAFAYISDDTPCPHTHGYDARFRLYWSDAGPDDFDDLNLVDDIETAIYDLFGITRDNHLAALPTAFDNIVERDNFYDYKLPQVGLQLAGVYR